MRPIPHTSAYRPESKLLETDRAQRTMFRIQEFKSTEVQEYQMSDSNIIIMSSPLKSGNHE